MGCECFALLMTVKTVYGDPLINFPSSQCWMCQNQQRFALGKHCPAEYFNLVKIRHVLSQEKIKKSNDQLFLKCLSVYAVLENLVCYHFKCDSF